MNPSRCGNIVELSTAASAKGDGNALCQNRISELGYAHMDSGPASRTCHLRAEIERAIQKCQQTHTTGGLLFRTVLDPRLPQVVNCDAEEVARGLRELLTRAVTEVRKPSPILIAYEMDDTSRSILRFEIEGTALGFSAAQETGGPVREVENRWLSILVAEDNAVNQQMAIECLRSLHHECEIVADGRAAVDASAKTAYDVIFMDVHMPVMDGLEATRQIRKLPNGDRPYITALTAYALPGDKARCLEAGMNDYIAKPCRAQNLARILEKVRGPLSPKRG
jgi:CheY-like chemotaxis protein